VIPMDEFARSGVQAVGEEALRVVGGKPTYLSFDIDSLDPAFAPGTGTPEVGGLTTLQAQELIRMFRGLDLVGADVVEVAPPFDPTGITALAGATMMYELLCILSAAVEARQESA
jgi:guanidinopropionase